MKNLLIIFLVIIVCCGIAMGGGFFLYTKLSGSLNSDFVTALPTFESFCNDLGNGNYQQAYQNTASEYQQIMTLSKFTDVVAPALKSCSTFTLSSPLVAKTVTVTGAKQDYFVGNIKFKDSTPDKFIAITFIYRDGQWKFAGFETDTTLNSIGN